MTMSKAERVASGALSCAGGPFGLPLWPLRNRPVRGGRTVPTGRSCSASLSKPRFAPRHRGPALDRDVDIGRIDVEAAKAAPGPLRRDQRRARAEEDVEHQLAATGHVLDRIGDQALGFTVGCSARSSRRLPAIEFTEA